MPLDPKNLDSAFNLLSELIALRSPSDHHSLVVCGGSALLAQQIISRSTHDVDVLAIRDWDNGVAAAYPLPEALKIAAAEVAKELRLDTDWLNSMASFHFPDLSLLPQSFWQELDSRDYGPSLTISFVSRSGQILLKIYASLNRSKPRDLDDLISLAPDSSETENAIRWVLGFQPGVASRDHIASILTYLGHGHLIQTFQG
ncbi:MAG: hypothetical protein EOP85_04300 [Verrucomicrobiaceae bacterium]|nr:MAG: hypothetical protein EOP85_04300 [Verrucomicrobiaceae bacterium]